MTSRKTTFYIPPSYTFTVGCSNPSTVISLAPLVSSCSSSLNFVGGLRPYYQQRKFFLTSKDFSLSSSTSSHLTVTIHRTDEEIFENTTINI